MKSLFMVLILAFTTIGYAHNYPNPVTPQQASVWVEQNQAILIDVREQSEVNQGMAKPALFYPKSSIDANIGEFIKFLSQYPDKKIIIYCRSGHRASVVVAALAQHGIFALNMGGYKDWVDAGLESRLPAIW